MGCVDEPWVRDYVAQELEPVKTGRLKPLEDSLAEIRTELQSLRKEVEEIDARFEMPESLEQLLEENREYLQWLQEDIGEMDTRLTTLEAAIEIPVEGAVAPEVVEPPPGAMPEEAPGVLPEEVRPPNEKVRVSESLEGSVMALADELKKLRARINDISRHIEHVDKQYQQYHGDVGRLRVDIMDEIDTLDKRMLALEDKISDVEGAQRAILAEMAERSQTDIRAVEQRLKELIEGLPK